MNSVIVVIYARNLGITLITLRKKNDISERKRKKRDGDR